MGVHSIQAPQKSKSKQAKTRWRYGYFGWVNAAPRAESSDRAHGYKQKSAADFPVGGASMTPSATPL